MFYQFSLNSSFSHLSQSNSPFSLLAHFSSHLTLRVSLLTSFSLLACLMTHSKGLDSAHIWLEDDDPGVFEQATMAFWIVDDNISAVFDQLQKYMVPFSRYPWFHSPPNFALHSYNSNRYLYGNLVYDANVNDEWLLVRLLWEFLQTVDSYIYLWDSTDGEFVLVEHYETKPEWLEPLNSRNRCWLHHGKLYLSQEDSARLLLEESIKMIKVGLFGEEKQLSGAFIKQMSLISNYYLELVHDIPDISLTKELASHFHLQPWLASRAILAASESKSVVESMDIDSGELPYTVGLPALTIEMVKFHNTGSLSEMVSQWLTYGYQILVDRGVVGDQKPNEKQGASSIDLSRSSYQKELVLRGRLKEIVPEKFELFNDENYEAPIEHEEIATHLREMLETTGELSDQELNEDEPDLDEPDLDEPDLDDFFEYFCKHELKLSDEQIQEFVAKERKKREYNDDSDYRSDSD